MSFLDFILGESTNPCTCGQGHVNVYQRNHTWYCQCSNCQSSAEALKKNEAIRTWNDSNPRPSSDDSGQEGYQDEPYVY